MRPKDHGNLCVLEPNRKKNRKRPTKAGLLRVMQPPAAKAEDPDEAILECLMDASGQDYQRAAAWAKAGRAILSKEDFCQEQLWRNQAVDANPAFYALPHFNFACLLERRGEADKARMYYCMALEADRTFSDAYFCLGELNLRQGRKFDALRHFEKFKEYGTDQRKLDIAKQAIKDLTKKAR